MKIFVFQCPRGTWQSQTPICFPTVKQGLNLEKETGIKTFTRWAQCQKPIGGIYFTKKWKAETFQPGSEFDNFKPRLKSSILKCFSCLNGSFLTGNDWGLLKEEVKTYLMEPRPTFSLSYFHGKDWADKCRFELYSLYFVAALPRLISTILFSAAGRRIADKIKRWGHNRNSKQERTISPRVPYLVAEDDEGPRKSAAWALNMPAWQRLYTCQRIPKHQTVLARARVCGRSIAK